MATQSASPKRQKVNHHTSTRTSSAHELKCHRAFVAIGSNVGPRTTHFIDALRELRMIGDVVNHSFLYETMPMYVTDQPSFLNAAVELMTHLGPGPLLHALKKIEVTFDFPFPFQCAAIVLACLTYCTRSLLLFRAHEENHWPHTID